MLLGARRWVAAESGDAVAGVHQRAGLPPQEVQRHHAERALPALAERVLGEHNGRVV